MYEDPPHVSHLSPTPPLLLPPPVLIGISGISKHASMVLYSREEGAHHDLIPLFSKSSQDVGIGFFALRTLLVVLVVVLAAVLVVTCLPCP